MRVALLYLIVVVFSLQASQAQTLQGQHDLSISVGWMSGRQVSDALGGERSPVNTKVTPSYFGTYRYFLRDKVALGVTLGSQTLWGRSSDENNYNPYTYTVSNATFAAEVMYVFKDFKGVQFYTLFGAGISHYSEQDVFLAPATAPVNASGNNLNFQYTPYAMRFGGKISGFLELGLGYKGILNGGLSYKFNSPKLQYRQALLQKISRDEIIILPKGFPLDKELKQIGAVKTGNPASNIPGDFQEQMNRISQKVNLSHGNVFQVDYINDVRMRDEYNIVGDVYSVGNYDAYKAKVQSQKKLRFENGTCAYLVIYRPDYNHTLNARTKTTLTLNGVTKLDFRGSRRYIIKVTREGNYTITMKNGQVIPVDIKFGNNYYIKTTIRMPAGLHVFHGRSDTYAVDDLMGELESSVIDDAHIMDLDTH